MRTHKSGVPAILALSLAAALLVSCSRAPQDTAASLIVSGNRYIESKDYVKAVIQFKNAIRLEPRNAEAFYRLGMAQLAAGNMLEAVPALVKAAEIDPRHAGAQLALAQLLAGSSDKKLLEDGRQRVQAILGEKPNDSEALTTLALSESRLGDLASAEKHLTEALRESPSSLKASALLARIKVAQRDVAGAESVLRGAVDGAKGSATARLVMAEFYLALGRVADAEKELHAALTADSKNARAMLGLAAVYAATGRTGEIPALYRRLAGTGDARYAHLYGAYLFSSGRREEAVREFENIARRDPSNRDARTRLVAAYLVVNRPADAERILTAALAKNPKDTDALLQKATMEVRTSRYTDAQKSLSEVLRYKPDSAAAHHLLAKVHEARGESRLQRQELTQAVQLRPDMLEARIDLARALIEGGTPQPALDLLNQASASQQQDMMLIILRNHALLVLGNEEECGRGVAAGLLRWRAPDLLVQDAELKLRRKDYSASRASVNEALKLSPEHIGALGILFRIVSAEKNVPSALTALKEYAAAHPSSARVQHYTGERLLANGRSDEARRAFSAAKAADPNSLDAEIALAQLDLRDKNLAAARQRLSGVAARAGDRPAVQILMAALEHAAGNQDAAIAHYRKVLELYPNQVLVLTNLAYLLGEYAQRVDEALPYAQKAKELNPTSADAAGVLGWLYYRKGIYSTALQHLRDATAIDSASTGSGPAFRRCYLGLTYLKLGQRQPGLAALEQALTSDPAPRDAEVARAALRDAGRNARN
jgi:tetratricopeptide (TPR) repeat protein